DPLQHVDGRSRTDTEVREMDEESGRSDDGRDEGKDDEPRRGPGEDPLEAGWARRRSAEMRLGGVWGGDEVSRAGVGRQIESRGVVRWGQTDSLETREAARARI